MKLLLTSSGVTNPSIERSLTELLGKPIADASALFVPTAINPFPGAARMAYGALTGERGGRLAALGWKSLGLLELTVLPTIDEEAWIPTVRESDALLFWGGDPVYLAHWIRESGLGAILADLPNVVYVGVSAGSMAATSTFAETYTDPPKRSGDALATEQVTFDTPAGPIERLLVKARGAGLVEFALIPHFEMPNHPDASLANAEIWARAIPAPTYAIDDQSAIKVVDGVVEIVSEGRWKLFEEAA